MLHVAMINVRGDCWFYLCTANGFLNAQCVQPLPAQESHQSDLGQVRLLKPAIFHTVQR
jgi:hypothetical protein